MPCSYKEAQDEIFAAINAAWSGSTSIAGYVPTIYWPGQDLGSMPDNKFCAEVFMELFSETQLTLSSFVGTPTKRHYTSKGVLTFGIHGPKANYSSHSSLISLSELVHQALRKGTANVIVRNCYIRELKPFDGMPRFAVVTTFQFDTIQ